MEYMEAAQKRAEALIEGAAAGDLESIGWIVIGVWSVVFAVAAGMLLIRQGNGKKYPPVYSEGFPVLGNPILFARDPLGFAKRGYDKYGDCFTIKMAHKRLTFLLSPKAHEVSLLPKDTEVNINEIYGFTVPVFGPGVVYDAETEERAFQFKMLGSGLRLTKLKSYVPQMVEEAEDFFAQWGDEGEVDLFQELSKLIILTASRCLLGKEVREEMFDEVAHLIHVLDEGMMIVSIFAPYLPLELHRQRDKARRDLQNLFTGVIAKRKATGYVGDDLLQVFIDSKRKDGSHCDDFTIVGLLIAAIFAGQHTSSITSTWLGLHLIRDKGLLEKVEKEQETILGEYDGEICFEALQKMDNLHRIMKEVLRLYPPLIFLMRTAESDRPYKDFMIPQGDILFMSPQLTGRNPDLWSEPEKFDPDRFAEPRLEDKKSRFTFMGFGGGRHSCMGEQFAYIQVKTIWSTLLRDFELEPVGELNVPKYEALVVGPKGPTPVRYRRKTKSSQS